MYFVQPGKSAINHVSAGHTLREPLYRPLKMTRDKENFRLRTTELVNNINWTGFFRAWSLVVEIQASDVIEL